MKLLVVVKKDPTGPSGAPQFPGRNGMFNYAVPVGGTDLYVAVIEVEVAFEVEDPK